jgi:hypothetical protein
MLKPIKQMESDKEFSHLGKDLPYQVPKGFFDQLAERTLLKAKQREEHRKKKGLRLMVLSVAASLTALIALSVLFREGDKQQSESALADQQEWVETPAMVIHEPASEQPIVAESEAVYVEEPTVRPVDKPDDETELAGVLTDLTDEELLLLAMIYEADPFIEESTE